MPRTDCPACFQPLGVTEAMLGGEVECGSCGRVFVAIEAGSEDRQIRYDDRADDFDNDYDDRDYAPRRRRRRSRRPRRSEVNGMGVASLVIGICSLSGIALLFCCGPFVIVTLIGSAIGLILGISAYRSPNDSEKGFATAGMIVSGIGLAIQLIGGLVFIVAFFVVLAADPPNRNRPAPRPVIQPVNFGAPRPNNRPADPFGRDAFNMPRPEPIKPPVFQPIQPPKPPVFQPPPTASSSNRVRSRSDRPGRTSRSPGSRVKPGRAAAISPADRGRSRSACGAIRAGPGGGRRPGWPRSGRRRRRSPGRTPDGRRRTFRAGPVAAAAARPTPT